MGEVQVPADALWRAQTQRAVENFPISGTPLEPRLVHALGAVKAAAAVVNGELGVLDADAGRGDRAPRPRGGRGPPRRPLPGRRLPDRVGHLLQHERQRGDRLAGRPRPASRCTPTTTSTPASRATTPSRPPIHVAATLAVVDDLLPALDVLAGSLEAQGRGVRRRREVRPHPPDGRDAGDARPGVRRLRRHGALRRRAARRRAPPGARAAARRHRRRHRHQHPARVRRRG